MPTVVTEERFRFVINTRENRFEPPHVHVWVDNQDTCRIYLLSGAFIERPLPVHQGNLGDHLRGVSDEHREGRKRRPDDDRGYAGR